MARKIATCSYCGTRAVLVLDKARHELSCGACGAPLHDMKFMPQLSEVKEKYKSAKPVKASKPAAVAAAYSGAKKVRKSKPKKRKPFFRHLVEELWDEVEDIFD